MNLVASIRYLIAVCRCLAWVPPAGLEHTVTISGRLDDLAVNLVDPGGFIVTMKIDASSPLRGIHRELDEMSWMLTSELKRGESGVGSQEPELMWD